MASRLPQAIDQLANGLIARPRPDGYERLMGPSPVMSPATIATAGHWVQNASGSAQQLQLAVANGHEVVSGLARAGDDEGSGPSLCSSAHVDLGADLPRRGRTNSATLSQLGDHAASATAPTYFVYK